MDRYPDRRHNASSAQTEQSKPRVGSPSALEIEAEKASLGGRLLGVFIVRDEQGNAA